MTAHPTAALFAAAALLVAPAPVLAATAPRVGIASIEQLPRPLPLPYDPAADADRDVAAAAARAKAGGRKLLIDLGGNWCLDCRILAGVMGLPAVRAFMARHYEVVTVDIGRMDKNQQIAARYGVKGRLRGVPAVLIVDPETNRLVNRGAYVALADARSFTPQALADWLARWV